MATPAQLASSEVAVADLGALRQLLHIGSPQDLHFERTLAFYNTTSYAAFSQLCTDNYPQEPTNLVLSRLANFVNKLDYDVLEQDEIRDELNWFFASGTVGNVIKMLRERFLEENKAEERRASQLADQARAATHASLDSASTADDMSSTAETNSTFNDTVNGSTSTDITSPSVEAPEREILSVEDFFRSLVPKDESRIIVEDDEDDEDDSSIPIQHRAGTQRARKAAARAALNGTAEAHDVAQHQNLAHLFREAQLPEPTTVQEATNSLSIIEDRRKNLLKDLLSIMRTPAVKSDLKRRKEVAELQAQMAADRAEEVATQKQEETTAVHTLQNQDEDRYHKALFPSISPLKAAMYFGQDADQLGRWRLFISGRALRDIRQLDETSMENVLKKLVHHLSKGHFSNDNMKPLQHGKKDSIAIFEAKVGGNLRIVWSVDIGHDPEDTSIRQIIRIWGIEKHNTIDHRLWDAVAAHSARYDRDHIRRVTHRETPRRRGKGMSDVTDPKIWKAGEYKESELAAITQQDSHDATEEEMLALHNILVLQKFVPVTKHLVLNIRHNITGQADVFDVSFEEAQVINHHGSLFVIGRSGTGKTTTCLFRMIGMEIAFKSSTDVAATALAHKPRQLFVTQSRVLAQKVKEQYDKRLAKSLTVNLGNDAVQKIAAGTEKATAENTREYLDVDALQNEASLPSRWSELDDSHFPLFLSYGKLCELLEGDYEAEIPAGKWQRDIITSEDFFAWWPTFPAHLTKRLDPLLVFSEILGTLQGSELAFRSEKGYVEEIDYLDDSRRANDILSDARARIYLIFKIYMEKKAELRRRDAADRTRDLLTAMSKRAPSQVEFIYVDEAQDNLLIDCRLLRVLSSNPHGFFFAGDTAQTITSSNFRWQDLSLQYWELEQAEWAVEQRRRKYAKPGDYQLSTNYRSHHGIIKAANSLVETIFFWWPRSIDKVRAEKANISIGPRPKIFLSRSIQEILKMTSQSENNGEMSGEIEFGAEQVFIVRTEERKAELRKVMGETFAQVLTIYESKGLEFNDVIMFDLFHDSQAQATDWRLLLNRCSEESGLRTSAPRFDPLRHSTLNRELKSLYVALTRARAKVYIFDRSVEKAEPFKLMMQTLGLCDVASAEEALPQIAQKSTLEEWAARAEEYWNRQQFSEAAGSFRKARNFYMEALCKALTRKNSLHTSERNNRDPVLLSSFKDRWLSLADVFESIATEFTENNVTIAWRRAGECFKQASDHKSAARCYEIMGDFDDAVLSFRSAGAFDSITRLLLEHEAQLTTTLRDMLDITRFEYLRTNQYTVALTLFSNNPAEMVSYVESNDLLAITADLYESLGDYSKVAELRDQEGAWAKAADAYSKVPDHQRSLECRVTLIWQLMPLGSPVKDEVIEQILAAEQALTPQLSAAVPQQVNMMQLLRHRIGKGKGSDKLLTEGPSTVPWVFATTDFLATTHHIARTSWAALSLKDTILYIKTMSQYASLTTTMMSCNLQHLPVLQLMLAFDDRTEFLLDRKALPSHFRFHVTTPLRKYLPQQAVNTLDLENTAIIDYSVAAAAVRSYLSGRFYQALRQHHEAALTAKVLRGPCIDFVTAGISCAKKNNCPNSHISLATLTESKDYILRIDALRTLLSLSTIPLEPSHARCTPEQIAACKNMRAVWNDRLFAALYPMMPAGGSIYELDNSSIAIRQTLAQFANSQLSALSYDGKRGTFLRALLASTMLAADTNPLQLSSFIFVTTAARTIHPDLMHNDLPIAEQLAFYIANSRAVTNVSTRTLSRGRQFAHWILTNGESVDINLVVAYIEDLVSFLIVGARRKWLSEGRATGFNGLKLPLQMLKSLVMNHFHQSIQHDDAAYGILNEVASTLIMKMIRQAHSAEDFLAYAGQPLKKLSKSHQIVLVHRLCRMLALVGTNLPELRSTMLEHFKNLTNNFAATMKQQTLKGFYNVTAWDKVEAALQTSGILGPIDELTEVRVGTSTKAATGYKILAVSKLEQLPQRLKLSAALVVKPIITQPISNLRSSKPKKKETKAAVRLQNWIRRSNQRHKPSKPVGQRNSDSSISQSAVRQACKHMHEVIMPKPDKSTEAKRAYLRLLFGPATNLLAGSRMLKEAIFRSQVKLRPRLRTETHDKLKDVQNALTRVNRAKKAIISFLDEFDNPALHRYHDKEQLQSSTCRAVRILDNVSVDLAKAETAVIKEHLLLAHKGIVDVAVRQSRLVVPTAKKGKKPALNTRTTYSSTDEDAEDEYEASDPDDVSLPKTTKTAPAPVKPTPPSANKQTKNFNANLSGMFGKSSATKSPTPTSAKAPAPPAPAAKKPVPSPAAKKPAPAPKAKAAPAQTKNAKSKKPTAIDPEDMPPLIEVSDSDSADGKAPKKSRKGKQEEDWTSEGSSIPNLKSPDASSNEGDDMPDLEDVDSSD